MEGQWIGFWKGLLGGNSKLVKKIFEFKLRKEEFARGKFSSDELGTLAE